MGIQSLGDKENKRVIQNQLKIFTNGGLVHLVYFPYIVSVIPLYN